MVIIKNNNIIFGIVDYTKDNTIFNPYAIFLIYNSRNYNGQKPLYPTSRKQ